MSHSDLFLVVCYDIQDTKKRTELFRTLKNYGQWMQYSVFECRLSYSQHLRLRQELSKIQLDAEDSIRLYQLCRPCQVHIEKLGKDKTYPQDALVV